MLTCLDIEVLLADYVDGTLPESDRIGVETHLASCAACAEFARDVAGAVQFVESAALVEPPKELVNKILFQVGNGVSRAPSRPSLLRRVFGKTLGGWLEPVVQPRFAMGMAMTMLSFAMLGRQVHVRQLKPSDLDPVAIWNAAEDRVARTWDRGVKYYESLRVVFEVQSRLSEWSEESARRESESKQGQKQDQKQK